VSKRKAVSSAYRFRDPKTGRFTKTKARREVIREEYASVGGRLSKKLATDRGKFKSPPKQRMPAAEREKRLVWEGSNRGMRFDDMLEEGKVLRKLEARGARRVVIEVEAHWPKYLKAERPVRRTIEMLLASKGAGRRIKNRKVLLLALIHAIDGTGLKMYPPKLKGKREVTRLFEADKKLSNIRIWALTAKKKYLPSEGFADVDVSKGVKVGRKKKRRYKANKETAKRGVRRS
jgi:hypothetical protein